MVEEGPKPAIHGVVRWRLIDLAQWIFEEYRISVSKQILSRELRSLGYRKLSARPRHHAQDEAAARLSLKKRYVFSAQRCQLVCCSAHLRIGALCNIIKLLRPACAARVAETI